MNFSSTFSENHVRARWGFERSIATPTPCHDSHAEKIRCFFSFDELVLDEIFFVASVLATGFWPSDKSAHRARVGKLSFPLCRTIGDRWVVEA